MVVTISTGGPYELKFAAEKLSSWLGIPLQERKTVPTTVTLCKMEDWKSVDERNVQHLANGRLASVGEEGYLVRNGVQERGVLIAGNTTRGTANGVLDFLRVLQKEDIRNPLSRSWDIESKPYFDMRDLYHMPTPWNLARLSVDSFTRKDWEEHLEFMRMVNIKRIIFDVWSSHYYHPEYEETYGNRHRYEVWREAMRYAHKLGIQTSVVLFPSLVPTFLFYRYPEYRAKERFYWGNHLCWSKAKELIFKFDRYFLEYFGDTLDRCIVEFLDPGECLCDLCLPNFCEVLVDIVNTYAPVVAENTREGKMELITWMLDWIEPQHPNLRTKVLDRIDKGIVIIDAHRETLDLAQERGFKTAHFFFAVDPEDGTEWATIFPRPKIGIISRQVEDAQKHKEIGLMTYRLTPYTGFMGDYFFLRKCWDPALDSKEIVRELSSQVMQDEKDQHSFARAVFLLEDWSRKGNCEALQEAGKIMRSLANARSYYRARVKAISDCVDVLVLMDEYREKGAFRYGEIRNSDNVNVFSYRYGQKGRVHDEDLFEELVDRVYSRMQESEIFRCYTADEHWIHRAKKMIAQRLVWWYGTQERLEELYGGLESNAAK